jgi:F-type H+-transporting ATPase subunit gamma
MATSMRAVKLRITATKKTSQITKAMNMISASKLKNAERHIKDYRPFLEKIEEILANIMQDQQALSDVDSIFLKPREIKKICYIVISSDKGLAGAFNINVLKELKKNIEELPKGIDYTVASIGLKSFNFVVKNNYNKFNEKPIFIRDDVEFHEMTEFIRSIVVGYILGSFDEVRVIYNHYINTLIQNVKVSKLLPIVEINKQCTNSNYEYDGKMEDILNMVLPIYIENLVYGFILDSKASEHASRMNSMKKATDNATEVVGKLELLYNRARQQAITLELTDIIGGASVINKK